MLSFHFTEVGQGAEARTFLSRGQQLEEKISHAFRMIFMLFISNEERILSNVNMVV